jgi:hypothetical protein
VFRRRAFVAVALARESLTRARRFARPFAGYFYSGKGVEIATIRLRLCCSALAF